MKAIRLIREDVLGFKARTSIVLPLILTLVILSLMFLQVLSDYKWVIADAVSDAESVRDAMIGQTRQTLSEVDSALTGIASAVTPNVLESSDTHVLLRARQDDLAPTFAIFVLDRDGRLVGTSRAESPDPTDFSALSVFQVHRDDPVRGLYIEPPRKELLGDPNDRWIFNVSRRLEHLDGSFAGIVAASMSVDYLVGFYDAMRVGDRGLIGLATDDGIVIARSPLDEPYVGQSILRSRLFEGLAGNQVEGTFRATAITDGVDRVIAFGRVPQLPVIVYVGISAQERLASWRRRVMVDCVVRLLAISLLLMLSHVLTRLFSGTGARAGDPGPEVHPPDGGIDGADWCTRCAGRPGTDSRNGTTTRPLS